MTKLRNKPAYFPSKETRLKRDTNFPFAILPKEKKTLQFSNSAIDKYLPTFGNSRQLKIAFIMRQLPFECDHVLIKLPNSRLFDGGIGVHDFNIYKGNNTELVVMEKYDLKVLDKHAFGLIRTYPHIHNDFSISKISALIAKYLDNIYKT